MDFSEIQVHISLRMSFIYGYTCLKKKSNPMGLWLKLILDF